MDHPFARRLDGIFNFAPHPSLEQEEGFEVLETSSPLNFYDRHIDDALRCKNVEDFSSLGPLLSKICDDAIAKFLKDGHSFPLTGYYGVTAPKPTSLSDARSVNEFYEDQLGLLWPKFPAIFYLHPKTPTWSPAFGVVAESIPQEKRFSSQASLVVNFAFPDGPPKQGDKLAMALATNGTTGVLKCIAERYPHIANWHFYPMTSVGKALLKQLRTQRLFRWETSRTAGYTTAPSVTVPPDAEDGILRKARIISIKSSRVSRRLTKQLSESEPSMPALVPPIHKKSTYIKVSRKPLKARRLDAHQYIQRAWATAVEQDSTFIIFNCGMYERIGVRHRSSQTLYLSPLIEPINCQSPRYGKLHMGLHVAILQDVLQRIDQTSSRSAGKHSGDPESMPSVKHCSASILDDDLIKQIANESNKREVALVTLKYGVYCSPVPATFLRLGSSCAPGLNHPFQPTTKSKFSQSEYIELAVREPVGYGAVGVVHPVTLSLTLGSGETLRQDTIVKLAFSEKQREKLRHEYSVYSHLASSKKPVEGIVVVHGLFEDPDSGTLALLMEDAGQTLRYLKKTRPARNSQLLNDERQSCRRALESIHRAGVRHRDIRPENILINGAHKISIIDFDCAIFEPEPVQSKFDREMLRLDAVLNGEEVDGAWYS